MDIGRRIREIRKANNQKLLNISQQTGLSQPFISEIERGIKVPSIETLEKICSALGITLAEFFADQAPELPPDIRQMIDVARKLTPLQRELIISVMKEMAKDNQTEGE
ncbi:transcriptional regulator with XRE-family HTH domain [Desulfofundulus luciae]|jgi:transcriptional regulator with XRE-family HTH domain|uniref:Transcriptional regulator with XRE-family HTH domain n=1 Tax=Desulfofundulus luciae TaxID=74702 RepID=A0ABU0B696_9FIRM|nr:helix-turn-helix transcriptional regulator [Desulfofundulus luciae]MBE3586628.1 helix-turn-helix transcriptional regulator [Thermoanaerobacter sp.]MDQ0287799.1 transcriptional regulator with XRE-family HTH domain [Desulfofundulus luciae]